VSDPLTVSGNRPVRFEPGHDNRGERGRTTRGTTFAALPPSSVRNTRTRAHVEPSREDYWCQQSPVLEKIDWNTTSIFIPKLAPYTETTQIKKTIHKVTVQRIRNSRASWEDKVDLLANRYQEHAASSRTQANSALQDLGTYNSQAYTFEDIDIRDTGQDSVRYRLTMPISPTPPE
jgi:hypothetical protein